MNKERLKEEEAEKKGAGKGETLKRGKGDRKGTTCRMFDVLIVATNLAFDAVVEDLSV